MLGALSPYALTAGFLYAAMLRHKWLTAGSKLQGASLVRSLKLSGDNLILNTFTALNTSKSQTLDLFSTRIKLVESDARKDSYYLIQDVEGNSYIMPLDENAIADYKLLNYLSCSKMMNTTDYNITNLLISGKNQIDITRNNSITNDVDNLARINILAAKGVGMSDMTMAELQTSINSIPDSEVTEYLERMKNSIQSDNNSMNSVNSVNKQIEQLFITFGLNRNDAVNFASEIRKRCEINELSQLGKVSKEEFEMVFDDVCEESEIGVDEVYRKVKVFFESLNKH